MSVNIIKLNRGDSFEFNITIPNKNETAENYYLTDNDIIYFALMYPRQHFEEAFLIKGFTSIDQDPNTGEILIRLTPNDTRFLSPGIYYYTVKWQKGGTLTIINDLDEPDEVHTIIERTKFILNE